MAEFQPVLFDAGVFIGALLSGDPPQSPENAANAVRALVTPPSGIYVIHTDWRSVDLMLNIVVQHKLMARRVHDARHAATILAAGITKVYTYDINDWHDFATNGIEVVGPPSVVLTL